jgi:hypothetical protein
MIQPPAAGVRVDTVVRYRGASDREYFTRLVIEADAHDWRVVNHEMA